MIFTSSEVFSKANSSFSRYGKENQFSLHVPPTAQPHMINFYAVRAKFSSWTKYLQVKFPPIPE